MKKYMGICMVSLLAGMGPMAMADNEWGVFGSYWSASDGDDGFGGGAKIGIEMVENVQLDLRYSAINNLISNNGADLDVQPLEFGLSMAIPMNEKVEPYIGVGLGYYFMDGDIDGFDVEVDDEWGFNVSVGLEIILARSKAQYGQTTTKLFIEAMYRDVSADDMKVSGNPPRLESADLGGFGAQAGLLIGW